MDRYNRRLAEHGYRPNSYQKGTPGIPKPAGRWPANLILQHLEGCRCEGTKRVKAITGGKQPHRQPAPITQHGGFKESQNRAYFDPADADGKETVPNWICVEGCPVAGLDEQSGVRTSGTGAVKRRSSRDRLGNTGAAYGAESRPEGTPMVTHGDTGGASRYFKQITPDQQGPGGGQS